MPLCQASDIKQKAPTPTNKYTSIYKRLQAESKVQKDVLDKLLHAYAIAENVNRERKMHGAVERTSYAWDKFDPTLSTKKRQCSR